MKRKNKIHLSSAVPGVLFVGLLMILPGASVAGSVLDTSYGSPAGTLGAEVDAMAGTGAAYYRGGLSARLNPAMLSEERDTRLDGSVSLYQDHEDRFQPLWDSFGSYVTDTAIASNRNHYFDSDFGAAIRAAEGLAVGLSLSTLYDFTYDFAEEVRDPDPTSTPYDQILEERSWRYDGRLRALSLGFAMSTPDQRLSVGVAGHYAFGTRYIDVNRRYFQSNDNSVHLAGEHWLEGANATLGLRIKATPRFEIGAAWETPLKVSGEATARTEEYDSVADTVAVGAVAQDVTIEYANRFRVGFTLYPRSDPRTIFTADMVFSEWTQLTDSSLPDDEQPRFEDTVDMRIGVEHIFYNGVPLRFGFRHMDSYSDHEAGATFFTTGIGVPWQHGVFHLSAELSKVTSYQEHWFPYEYDDPTILTALTARVEETRFRLGAGFTYLF
ncbi:hypothetical protein KKG45_01050 [bacterium]|nr:hypothetical protein [bacterium]MBU1071813.1 hypothetical protein [bacterium]MBU1677134.1 hypothetical protein [bacterium]